MKYTKTISTVVLVSMSVLPFSACNSMSGAQIMATGTAGGAAMGALIGNMIGGDTKATLIGAGIGAAVGLIGGYVWSATMVKDRSEYPTAQAYVQANNQQLDTRIAQAQQANRQTNAQMTAISQNKKKLSTKEKQTQTSTMARNISLMEQDIQTAQKASQEASGAELEELRNKINILASEKAQMEANRQAIASISTI